MKNIIQSTLLILFHLCQSCVQLVSDELDSMPSEVVMNGILVEGENAWIHLSWTTSFKNANFNTISNAEVWLYRNGEVVEQLSHLKDGYYAGSEVIAAGSSYTCRVHIPSYGELTATDKIPHPVSFANEKSSYGVANEEGIAQPKVSLDINHEPGKTTYFDLGVFTIIRNERLSQPFIVSPFDQVVIHEGIEANIFSNIAMNNSPYTFQTHLYANSVSCSPLGCVADISPIILELRTVSYHLYRYLQQAYLQEQAGIPEFGIGMPPPINSYSNVENGRGIFAAYSYMRSDTIPPPPRPF